MKLKSLPKLLTTQQLKELVIQFPEEAQVFRADTIITVTAPNGVKVLSAIKHHTQEMWHVMAMPKLVHLAVS
jgi:hypothetical protein